MGLNEHSIERKKNNGCFLFCHKVIKLSAIESKKIVIAEDEVIINTS